MDRHLSNQFLACISEKDGDHSQLNHLLNELNALCCEKHIDPLNGARLLAPLVNIPVTEDTLVVKACCLIYTLHRPPHNIRLNKADTLNLINWLLRCVEARMFYVICDVLKSLTVLFENIQCRNALPLDYLLSEKGLFIVLLERGTANTLSAMDEYRNEEIVVDVLMCLGSLLCPSKDIDDSAEEIPLEYLTHVGSTLITKVLFNVTSVNYGESGLCAVLTASLDIFAQIVSRSPDFAEQYSGELLGLAKTYMTWGLLSNDKMEVKPQALKISQQTIIEPQEVVAFKRSGGKNLKKRKPRNGNRAKNKRITDEEDEDITISRSKFPLYTMDRLHDENGQSGSHPWLSVTSASDMSESETKANRVPREQRMHQARLRIASIALIEKLAKMLSRKTMFGYWHSLFVTSPNPASALDVSLPYLVVTDPNKKCRCLALHTISMIVRNSKGFLSQAESDHSSSSFTTFSVSLGRSLQHLYALLTRALNTELHVPVLIQILKCFSSLIQATAFGRLDPGLIAPVVKCVRRLIYHRDWDVKVSSMMVMGFVLSIQEMTAEIVECVGLTSPVINSADSLDEDISLTALDLDFEDESDIAPVLKTTANASEQLAISAGSTSSMSWLLKVVLEVLGVNVGSDPTTNADSVKLLMGPAPTPLKLECLHILSTMTCHLDFLRGHLHYVAAAIKLSLQDPAVFECHLFAVRVIDYIGHAIDQNLSTTDEKLRTAYLEEGVEFWRKALPLLEEQLQRAPQSNYAIKPVCCDALSNIGPHLFEKLPNGMQMHLIALLHGCFYESDSSTKASAGRALAVYVMYPSLKHDLTFIQNTSEMIIELFEDSNVLARMKATWSLGNILEAIVDEYKVNESEPRRLIADVLMRKFFTVSIKAARDVHEKIRCNVMRVLGNLVRLLSAEMHLVHAEWRELALAAMQEVVKSARTFKAVKVKWNACYTMGVMMQNGALYEKASPDFDWQPLILSTLCDLLVASPNFKVRATAVIALGTPADRHQYGPHFEMVWRALTAGMEQANHLIDFNEYKHRDHLLDQLCITVAHLIVVCDHQRDVCQMRNDLLPVHDVTKQNWFRVVNRILPEQAVSLISAASKLADCSGCDTLSADQREAIKLLSQVFVAPLEYNI